MNYAIILAGGAGTRFNSGIPKQFIELTGVPMLVYSMKTAQTNSNIDRICVVANPSEHQKIQKWAAEYGVNKLKYFAEPGETRQRSVYSGLCSIPAENKDTVLIMTAVCPFVSQATIDKQYNAINTYDASITVVKATDAISFSNDAKSVNRTLQKHKLFIQQGPQIFRYGILRTAHRFYMEDEDIPKIEVTEDSELVLSLGVECGMVLGDRFCIKITYPEDLAMAESLRELFEKQEETYAAGIQQK